MGDVFTNKYGEISVGEQVWFDVENQNCNYWPKPGALRHDGKVFYIETTAGRLDINTWLGAYKNTIKRF